MAKDPIRQFDPSKTRRPRRLEERSTAETGFPIIWVLIGGLSALIVIGLVGLGVVNIVRQSAITPTPQLLSPLLEDVSTSEADTTPAESPAEAATPTSESPATPTPEPATPTPEPTIAPQLRVDGYAVVANTGGAGVRVRPGPRRAGEDPVLVAPEETIVQILAGPTSDENQEDYIWWQIRIVETGEEGWVVEDFISPAQAP